MAATATDGQAKPDLDKIAKGLELLAKKLFTDVEPCLDSCMIGGPSAAPPPVPTKLRPEFVHVLTRFQSSIQNFKDYDEFVRKLYKTSTVSNDKVVGILTSAPNLLKTFIQAVGEVTKFLETLV